jgi:hypothetical protein
MLEKRAARQWCGLYSNVGDLTVGRVPRNGYIDSNADPGAPIVEPGCQDEPPDST